MKYDRLYNFISPVTGKIADYSQFPSLPENYIIIGNENNEPIVSPILISILDDIDDIQREIRVIETVITPTIASIVYSISNIKSDIEVIFDDVKDINQNINIINDDIANINVELTDIRLNTMDMRRDIDALQKVSSQDIHDAKFIVQIPDIRLPNAQALSDLDNGVLGNKDGVIEILQRVSGPTTSTDNNIAIFDGITGQVIKDSKVKIDGNGDVYANGLHVTNLTGKNTGFNASSLMLSDVLYSLPTTAGFPTQMLTTPGLPGLTGSYQLYWSTPPSQIKTDNPYDPSNPYPVFTPIPIPIPITTPFPVPVFVPTPGLPLGTVTASPVSIDPIKGDIDTPGNIDANDIHGNDASFDGDMDIDGDLSTQGDIDSLGDISAEGNVSGDAFDFEDISDLSDDFVRMEAPFDLDHSYQIELPDSEPIMQEQIQPPDQRILQTAWRRVRPESEINGLLSKNKKVDISLPITKMSWTDIEVEDPITLTFVQATSTTNEKMVIGYTGGGGQNIDIPYAVNLIYGTLNNILGSFSGFNSNSKDYQVKVKTSYNHKTDGSSSSITLFNRYDNGFIIKNETNNSDKCIFKVQNIENNIITDLLSYDQTNSSFKFIKPLEVPAPTLAKHPATKEYVDSIPIGGGVSQITAGTGLSGGTITTTGTIAIANTGVTAGSYRFGNFTTNAQGQLTNVSNGSPSTTTNRAIAVWGNTIGNSLLNTNVTIDTSGNMTSNGASTFLNQQVNNADGVGSLNFISGNYSLQVRLNGALTNNRLWFLPTTNNNGFFKNNGSGTITWSALSSSDINNFSTAVRQEFGQFSFGQNILRCNEPNLPMFLYSTFNETVLDDKVSIGTGMILDFKRITNLDDPVDLQDAATKNYVDSKPFYTSGDFYIQLNSSNKGGVVIPEGNYVAVPIFDSSGYLYVNSDGKLYYSNRRGTVLLGGA